jgi:hypothetical protein
MRARQADSVRRRKSGQGGFPIRIPWLRSAVAALLLCGAATAQAGNGEPPGGKGLFQSPACDVDFTTYYDDRFNPGVVSGHMRDRLGGDDGLAISACVDGRITVGAAAGQVLETNVTIQAVDFGELVCGEESGVAFCVLCQTVQGSTSKAPGSTKCVKLIDNGQSSAPSTNTCGGFKVLRDTTGACSSETANLRETFSDPRVASFLKEDASDAAKPGAKDLLLCGSRSWQCIDNPPFPLATQSKAAQPQAQGLINTPCCKPLASGRTYCSTSFALTCSPTTGKCFCQ